MIRQILLLLLILTVSAHAQNAKPALIPLPQHIIWGNGGFPLKSCKAIITEGHKFDSEVKLLQNLLKNNGLNIPVLSKAPSGSIHYIELKTGNPDAGNTSAEAYQLQVSNNRISLTASNSTGIFYGIQTLKQLIAFSPVVGACTITDWPAFSWRGYMIDAGRNYQPVALLKQQIDIMALYKLNIFHFHFTENIAWRLQSKLYPQLTAPENMERDKGKYYTEKEFKELIAYCKERHITLVPEIDMPGHSAAFKRAMKTDMQTDSGLAIVKNIIKEFCATYNLPYLHIGADEVKVTNEHFLPEVIALAEQLGKKVIGWEPGGHFTESTIRQLWRENAINISTNKNIKYIDSRNLYLNHMDPLESVTSIFFRKIADADKGNETALGGTICMWPDRRIGKPEDVFIQNAVYPAMLAFAERSWRGGGENGLTINIGSPHTKQAIAFTEFENRLIANKKLFFSNLPFPYVRQAGLVWKLYGPFNNQGNLSEKFMPELTAAGALAKQPAALTALGGTLILRHWWAPEIKGLIEAPKENTTWYAATHIWSNEDKPQKFWIGFNDLSRSYASDSPKAGTWDNRQSEVFVNGKPVIPPEWKQAGMKGNLEKPLIDEGYTYRKPAVISLKKGWNEVLVKLPVGSFKGTDWQNPEKWMFTFVPWL